MNLDELLNMPVKDRAKLTSDGDAILRLYFHCRPSAMTAIRVETAKASSAKKDLLARLGKLAANFEKELQRCLPIDFGLPPPNPNIPRYDKSQPTARWRQLCMRDALMRRASSLWVSNLSLPPR